jgi:hypothetical protein
MVSIWTSKPKNRTFAFMTGILSACGFELCFSLTHSLTHGQGIGADHSILTTLDPTWYCPSPLEKDDLYGGQRNWERR